MTEMEEFEYFPVLTMSLSSVCTFCKFLKKKICRGWLKFRTDVSSTLEVVLKWHFFFSLLALASALQEALGGAVNALF
jgi:hypothetical protein